MKLVNRGTTMNLSGLSSYECKIRFYLRLRAYRTLNRIFEQEHLCAGFEMGKQDACQGKNIQYS